MELNALTDCCRLCFSAKNEYINISENSASGLNVTKTIDKYVQIEAVDGDSLPNIVCTDCWTKIESFHYFHEMIITARTAFLTKFLKTEIKEDDDGKADTEEFFIENMFVESLIELDDEKPIINAESCSQSDQTQQNRSINETPIGAFICDICRMTFDSKILIEQHIVGTHVKPTQNRTDEGTFRNESNLNYSADFLCNKSQSNNSISYENGIGNTLTKNSDDIIPDYFDKTCDMCPTTFQSLNQARDHYLKKHKIANGYVKCCGAKFKIMCDIREHIRWHLNPNMFRCDLCQVSYMRKASLKKHYATAEKHKTFEPKHTCEICGKIYTLKDSLRYHRLKNHNIVGKRLYGEQITIPDYFDMSCDQCSIILKSLKHARSHYLEEHQTDKAYIKCCGKKFKSITEVQDHIKWHNNPLSFLCKICDISFTSSVRLAHHNVRHTKRLVCDVCEKVFPTKETMAKHRKRHDPKDEKYKCPTCNKIFSAQSQLNIHLKSSHEEAKTEICEYCAKRYVTKYLLRIHTENVHSKDPPKREKVQCNVCNAWFSFKNQLKSHMGTHTDPVKCDICQKLFKNQNSLYQHKLRFHTVTKAIFKCHLCPKTFLMTSSLQDHISSHSNEKSHKCSYCDQEYTWRCEMYRHQKKVHFKQWSADKDKKLASKVPENT